MVSLKKSRIWLVQDQNIFFVSQPFQLTILKNFMSPSKKMLALPLGKLWSSPEEHEREPPESYV